MPKAVAVSEGDFSYAGLNDPGDLSSAHRTHQRKGMNLRFGKMTLKKRNAGEGRCPPSDNIVNNDHLSGGESLRLHGHGIVVLLGLRAKMRRC